MGFVPLAAQLEKQRAGTTRQIEAMIIYSGIPVPVSNRDQMLQRKV